MAALLRLTLIIVALAQGCTALPRGAPRQEALRPLTQSGTVVSAALSLDGKRVAWVDGERAPAVWWQNLATGEATRIGGSTGARAISLGDPDRLLVVEQGPAGFALVERRLDGLEVARREGVDAPVSLSPDGTQLAFARGDGSGSALVVVDRGRGLERVLARSASRQGFAPLRVGWSPDGRRLAATGLNPAVIRLVDVQTGRVVELPGSWRWLTGVSWPEAGHLLVTGTRPERLGMQAWQVDVASGAARPLTSGLINQSAPTAARDGRWLAIAQVQTGEVWRVPLDGGTRQRVGPPQAEAGAVDGYGGVISLPQGGYLACSRRREGMVLLVADAAGRERLLRRAPEGLTVGAPAVSSDGRLVAWQEQGSAGQSLLVTRVDGGEISSVLGGRGGVNPAFAPGDQALVYTVADAADTWSVPLVGGLPVLLARGASQCTASVSAGLLACFVAGGVGLLNPTTGLTSRTIATPGARPPARFTADGQGLLYVSATDETATLWLHPLDGPRRAVMTVAPGLIYSFSPTADGTAVLVSFGRHAADVMLHE